MALLDISKLTDHACEAGLEAMYKASTSDGGGGGDDWPVHESPFISELIERFTERGLTQIEGVRAELAAWIDGQHHKPTSRAPAAPGMIQRWTVEEQKLVKLYLESLAPSEFSPSDWSLLVDYLGQRYLPPEFAIKSGEWMAAKTVVMGAVEASGEVDDNLAPAVAAAAPTTVAAAREVGLTYRQLAILEYGAQRCAENIVDVSTRLRQAIKRTVLNHQEAEMLGDVAATAESLETKLLDNFGTANRDWRRIAMTEAVENSNQGFIASISPGGKVKRMERYEGACAFCRKIDGQEFSVVSPAKKFKDPAKEVWPGKTNVGRSAAPMKRVGGALIPRDPSELWWPAAGVQHPHCRGRWIPVKETNTALDDDFQSWMQRTIDAARPQRSDDE